MEFADLERILELVREHDLAEFELERDGLKVRIRMANAGPSYIVQPPPLHPPAAPPQAHAAWAPANEGEYGSRRRFRIAHLDLVPSGRARSTRRDRDPLTYRRATHATCRR